MVSTNFTPNFPIGSNIFGPLVYKLFPIPSRTSLTLSNQGAGIGIGLVFAALLQGVARNPSLRGQLFSYAILGFAFVEAIGLFDLMVAMMCKYV